MSDPYRFSAEKFEGKQNPFMNLFLTNKEIDQKVTSKEAALNTKGKRLFRRPRHK
jgi:hypothetical protein